MRLLAAAAMLAAIPATAAEPITGCIVSVHDGDTVRVLDATNVQHKVRLDGIDAPERGQSFGTVARDRLAALVMGKAVKVHDDGRDKWGAHAGPDRGRGPGREPADGRGGAGVALREVQQGCPAGCR